MGFVLKIQFFCKAIFFTKKCHNFCSPFVAAAQRGEIGWDNVGGKWLQSLKVGFGQAPSLNYTLLKHMLNLVK